MNFPNVIFRKRNLTVRFSLFQCACQSAISFETKKKSTFSNEKSCEKTSFDEIFLDLGILC